MKNATFLTVILILFAFNSNGQGTWSQTNLSTLAAQMGAVSYGSKIYFAGGSRGGSGIQSKIIDIYDINSQQWTIDSLSVARSFTSGIGAGGKVYFAGGVNLSTGVCYSVVDIYDTLAQQWATAQLSIPRFGAAAVTYGNDLLFAGGADLQANTGYKIVDKCNFVADVWTTDSISEPRGSMGYTVSGTKAYFAGGFDLAAGTVSNKIDVYDFNSGLWTYDTLSLARGFLAGEAVGDKIVFAGGMTSSDIPTDRVDIFDIISGNHTISSISTPRGFINYSAVACDKAFFVGGGNFNFATTSWTTASDIVDIYDPLSNSWAIENIPGRMLVNHSVVANDNHVFVAGGTSLSAIFHEVDVYNCTSVGIDNVSGVSKLYTVYPNPVKELLTIEFFELTDMDIKVTITDISGKLVYTDTPPIALRMEIYTGSFAQGVYFLRIQSTQYSETKRFVVSR